MSASQQSTRTAFSIGDDHDDIRAEFEAHFPDGDDCKLHSGDSTDLCSVGCFPGSACINSCPVDT